MPIVEPQIFFQGFRASCSLAIMFSKPQSTLSERRLQSTFLRNRPYQNAAP
jgi:hypothetical protein